MTTGRSPRIRVAALGVGIAACAGIVASAARADLVPSFIREQVGTLPRGMWFVSVVGLEADLGSQFDGSGRRAPLADQMSRVIRFQDVVADQPRRRAQLTGLLAANGARLDEEAGSVSGTLRADVSGKIPVIGYGLTDALGVYVTMPILRFRVRAEPRFTASRASERLFAELRETEQASVVEEFERAYAAGFESKLYRAGYAWSGVSERTYLGDLRIMALHVGASPGPGGAWRRDLRATLIAPTSNARDLSDFYGVQAGEHRWGLSARVSAERDLGERFRFNVSAASTLYLPNTQPRRLAEDADDDLRELADPAVKISGGAEATLQAQVRASVTDAVALNVGGTLTRHLRETWSGERHDPSRYADTARRTSARLLAGYAAAEYSFLPAFYRGSFAVPAALEAGATFPIAGANAFAETTYQFQGSLFF